MRYPAFAEMVRDGVAIVELSSGRTLAALQRRLGEDMPVTTLTGHANTVAAAAAHHHTTGRPGSESPEPNRLTTRRARR
jgi:hypothetical protein